MSVSLMIFSRCNSERKTMFIKLALQLLDFFFFTFILHVPLLRVILHAIVFPYYIIILLASLFTGW